ncbi:Ferrous-iron efflux pump FieF [compost metagenome]
MQAYQDLKQAEKGAWLSISVYIGLSIMKLLVGYFYASEALTADGFNNTTDIIVSVAVLIGLRISRKPPDHDHPYGHFRAETIATLIAAFIMAAVGIQVFLQALQNLIQQHTQTPHPLAAWVALLSAAIMYAVYVYNRKLAQRVNSPSLQAAAQDNRSDALVSAGAFVGIIGASLGWPWLDALTAMIVGFIICKTAWDIFRESSHNLTDGFDQDKLDAFKDTIQQTPGVEFMADIKARIHGNQVLVDVTIHVNEELSISEGHDISDSVEERMLNKHQISHVHVHIEPSVISTAK